VRAELAAEAIRRLLIGKASKVTTAEVLASYRRNAVRLRLGQLRGIQIIYGLPTRATALALRRRVGTGPGFAERALHEFIQLIPTQDSGKRALLHAIFSARSGVVSHPIKFGVGWALFVVKRIVLPRPLPFAQVQADARALLIAKRHRAITDAFLKVYRRRWVARTSCRKGYLVQQCPSYSGPRRAEVDPFWDPAEDRPALAPRPVRVPAPRG
jgi:foldase protein PrsA